jgi:hypothetical protein
MEFDAAKLDEIVLALLYLNMSTTARAWKGFDWDSLDRLHSRGLISNPKSKAKSVELTEEGARLAEESFRRHFGCLAPHSSGRASRAAHCDR